MSLVTTTDARKRNTEPTPQEHTMTSPAQRRHDELIAMLRELGNLLDDRLPEPFTYTIETRTPMTTPEPCPKCGQTHTGCTAHTSSGRPCKRYPNHGMSVCTTWRRHPASNLMDAARTCDNENAAPRWWNTEGPLTRSSGTSREGLAMKATHKRGLDPAPTAPQGLSADLKAIYDAWPERFRTKVTLSAACWEWTACKDSSGYGRYSTTRARGTQFAHRMALELAGIDVPRGHLTHVDHLCRNPSCVRPDHLEIVTNDENIRRGAAANSSGWCRSGRHEWTPENILTEPDGARRCRPCRDERERAYRPAKGTANGGKTHCPKGHPYDEANTYVRPNGSRECFTCIRARHAATKEASA